MTFNHLPHPSKCFCQIATERLRKWAIERHINQRSTLELLNSASNPDDREAISIVALLDADDETVLSMMGDVDLPDHHLLHCREKVRQLLQELNVA